MAKDKNQHIVQDIEGWVVKGARNSKATRVIDEGQVTIAAPADYTLDSAIDCAVKAMIDKAAANRVIADSGE